MNCPKDSVGKNLWGWTARCPFASNVSLSQCTGIPLEAGDDVLARTTIRERRSKILTDVIELESVSTLHDLDQEDVQEKICKEQDKWYKTQNTTRVCVYGYPTLTSSLFIFKSRIRLNVDLSYSLWKSHEQDYRNFVIHLKRSYTTIPRQEYEEKKKDPSNPFNYHFFRLISKNDFDLDHRMTKDKITWWRS